MELFDSWDSVLEYAKPGHILLYQAPMDPKPGHVRVLNVSNRKKTIRLEPWPRRDADPFTADSGHLSRFRKW